MYDSQLIAKSDYDTKKAAYDTATAQVGQAKAKLAQAKANLNSAQGHIGQNAANLRHASDVLSKTEYRAPFDGVITNVPVREGETVVPGIQNSPGSTLMTIADTSIITAEVKVDESDIVNVQLGQPAEITIDAMPKQKFKGVVSEIGSNAVLRSTGVSTAQTTSSGQEAKDFKVIVALQDPPPNLLPGLSATARITTAKRSSVLAIPIQALTIRERGELTPADKNKKLIRAGGSSQRRKFEGRVARRVRPQEQKGRGIRTCSDRHQRHDRHRSYRRAEGRRRNRYRQLQGAANAAQRRQREGG